MAVVTSQSSKAREWRERSVLGSSFGGRQRQDSILNRSGRARDRGPGKTIVSGRRRPHSGRRGAGRRPVRSARPQDLPGYAWQGCRGGVSHRRMLIVPGAQLSSKGKPKWIRLHIVKTEADVFRRLFSFVEPLRPFFALPPVRSLSLALGFLPFRLCLLYRNAGFRVFFCALHWPRFSAQPVRICDDWISFFAA